MRDKQTPKDVCGEANEQALLWGIGQRESKKVSLTMTALTMLTVFSGLL